jgi:hypothetical protein
MRNEFAIAGDALFFRDRRAAAIPARRDGP